MSYRCGESQRLSANVMKINRILFVLLALLPLAAGCTSSGKLSGGGLVAIIIIACLVAGGVLLYNSFQKQKRIDMQVKANYQAKLRAESQQQTQFATWQQQYFAANGVPDTTLVIKDNDKDKVIYIYKGRKMVWLCGHEYAFKDLTAGALVDNPEFIKGWETRTVHSHQATRLARMLLGSWMEGPTLAFLMGMTVPETVEIKRGKDHYYHNYTIIVNTRNPATPVVEINTGSDGALTNKVVFAIGDIMRNA